MPPLDDQHAARSTRSLYRQIPRFDQPGHWLEAGAQHENTLLLLHGLMANAMAFRLVLDSLAEHYHVFAPDLPSHGLDLSFQSPQASASLPDLVDWLEAFLDLLPDKPIHIVAHSLGATLAYNLLHRRPQLAQRIVFISPGFRIPLPTWSASALARIPPRLAGLTMNRLGLRFMEQLQFQVARMDRDEANHYLKPLRQPQRLRFMFGILAALAEQSDPLQTIPLGLPPTLLMWGRQDRLLQPRWARPIADKLHAQKLVLLDTCGHSPMEDQPQRFLQTVLPFLRER